MYSLSSSSNHLFPLQPSVAVITKKTCRMAMANSRAQSNLLTSIFTAGDNFINRFIHSSLPASLDPKYVLAGNFAPVEELPPTECQVIEGSLPPCLDGVYIRNGPNPQYFPEGPYHWFDGDGMLHCTSISSGKVTFCSRFVKTYKYSVEHEAGAPLLPNFFSAFYGFLASKARFALLIARILSFQFNLCDGFGVANTSLAFFGNRLFALCESDLPYLMRITQNGDIETLGRLDFKGKFLDSMTAHPKIDQQTSEAFAFRYSLFPPFLTYFFFDSNGNKQADVPIFSMTHPSLMHDFAISKNYAIFCSTQHQIGFMEMIIKGGCIVNLNPQEVPRIGIIPRYAKDGSEMRWFKVPGFNPMHVINAWDKDEQGEDKVSLVAANAITTTGHGIDKLDEVHFSMEKLTINLNTSTVRRCPISSKNLDLAVINTAYTGRKNRYVFAAIGDPFPRASGLVKLDISQGENRQDCTVGTRMYGSGCYGGEPFFVAREAENQESEEDDGYLITYVHDEICGESKLLVMDAKSVELDIVAAVKLPRRVPYGVHGIFLRENFRNF